MTTSPHDGYGDLSPEDEAFIEQMRSLRGRLQAVRDRLGPLPPRTLGLITGGAES